jgi:hypothetical protein
MSSADTALCCFYHPEFITLPFCFLWWILLALKSLLISAFWLPAFSPARNHLRTQYYDAVGSVSCVAVVIYIVCAFVSNLQYHCSFRAHAMLVYIAVPVFLKLGALRRGVAFPGAVSRNPLFPDSSALHYFVAVLQDNTANTAVRRGSNRPAKTTYYFVRYLAACST